jgi:hypothetical protein
MYDEIYPVVAPFTGAWLGGRFVWGIAPSMLVDRARDTGVKPAATMYDEIYPVVAPFTGAWLGGRFVWGIATSMLVDRARDAGVKPAATMYDEIYPVTTLLCLLGTKRHAGSLLLDCLNFRALLISPDTAYGPVRS